MSQSRNTLIYSSGLLMSAIVGIGLSLSAPKPLRMIPLLATMALSSGAAYFAQKGVRPAEIEAMDRAAELACLEAERENALEEIQESDDIERELSTYERRLNIEAEAMRRTFPAKIEMQKMQQLLYPAQIVINQSTANSNAAEVMMAPSVVTTPEGLFDWSSLKDADRHPMLGMIAKMGGGKSLLVKWLAKYIMGGTISVIDIYGSKKEWEGCHVMWDYEEMVLWMAEDNKSVEGDVARYREGKRDFAAQLVVLEEGKSTINRLKKLALSSEAKEYLANMTTTRPGAIVSEWQMNYESLTRKIRRRMCLVSTNMNASVINMNAESRDEMTIIFPGREGISKALKDTSMLKLGARANREIREKLIQKLQGIEYPALVYHDGEWFAAAIPKLDELGNPVNSVPIVGTPPSIPYPPKLDSIEELPTIAEPPVSPPQIQPPTKADLNRLLNLEVSDEDSDR